MFGSVCRHICDLGSCEAECSREYEDVAPSIGYVSKAHRPDVEWEEGIAIARAEDIGLFKRKHEQLLYVLVGCYTTDGESH